MDIFLIDWEKSKGKLITTNPPSATGTLTEDPNEKLKVAPVSIWRTYFVANEWNELQVCIFDLKIIEAIDIRRP